MGSLNRYRLQLINKELEYVINFKSPKHRKVKGLKECVWEQGEGAILLFILYHSELLEFLFHVYMYII